MNQRLRTTILVLAAFSSTVMPLAAQATANYDLVPAVNDTTLFDTRDYTCSGVTAGAGDTTSGPSGPVSKDQTAREAQGFLYFANKFLGEGASEAQARAWAAGIVGNLVGESGIDPNNPNTAANVGGSIAQWEGARWTNLVAASKKAGLKWDDNKSAWVGTTGGGTTANALTVQLEFLWNELHHSEKGALTAIKKTSTAGAAAVSFLLKFERPSIPREKARVDAANRVFKENAGVKLAASSTPATPTASDTTDAAASCPTADTPTAGSSTGGSNTAPCPKLDNVTDGHIQDGYLNGNKTPVQICIVFGVDVNTRIAKGFHDLFIAAKAAGYNFSGSGGFRTMKEQTDLYNSAGCPSHCSKPVATPGHSNHQMGLAIDFAGISIHDPGNPKFKWLKAHAKSYGLINLPSESWHWSINGK